MAPFASSATLHHDADDKPYHRVDLLLARAAEADHNDDGAESMRLRHQAVVAALDLADNIGRRYRGRGIEIDDLEQVARMALVKAVNGYRPDVGHGFIGYAVPTITGEIKRHFRDFAWAVRPPRRLQEIRVGMARQEELLGQVLQRDPSALDLAGALGVDESEVRHARRSGSAYSAMSLDATTADGRPLSEHLASPLDEYAGVDRREALRAALAQLDDREQQIVHLRFVDELTQAEIGQVFGVSQMQVSRILSAVIKKLRAEVLDEQETAA